MRRDTVVGIVSIAFGIIYSFQAFQLPKAVIGNPWAPIFFPATLGILTVLLGFAVLVVDLRKAAVAEKTSKKKAAKDPGFWILIVGTCALCLLYGLVFEKIGFIPSTLAFLGGLLFLVNGIREWKTNLVITAGFTFALWAGFVKLFNITLP